MCVHQTLEYYFYALCAAVLLYIRLAECTMLYSAVREQDEANHYSMLGRTLLLYLCVLKIQSLIFHCYSIMYLQ